MSSRLAVLAGCIFLVSCLCASAQEEMRLTEIDVNNSSLLAAIEATKTNLLARGFTSAEFYVSIYDEKDVVTLSLRHQDSLRSENFNVLGNPSGKDQECKYSKITHELSCLFYQ